MSRRLVAAGLVVALALVGVLAQGALVAAARPTEAVSISMPPTARPDRPFVVTLGLPARVSAVDGRVLYERGAIEVWGLAPIGGGVALRPEAVAGGVAFGAYDLRAKDGRTVLRIVMEARKTGRVRLRVVLDAMADRAGRRLAIDGGTRLASVGVAGGMALREAPAPTWDAAPRRSAGPTRDLLPDGRMDKQDLDATRIGWITSRLQGRVCGAAREGDANGDGCVDIVDVQAARAAQRVRLQPAGTNVVISAVAPGSYTFTVTSTADTPDATPGDGLCADSQGRCTLRAAIMEANWITGNDRIEFALPGTAPVTIQLGGQLPNLGRNGTLTIDGYTQPGSRANTATVGSNAVPGVEIKGLGTSNQTVGFFIPSSGNTLRGLALVDMLRPIFMDRGDAHDNRIVGNWIGLRKDGTLPAGRSQYAVMVNSGAHHNVIGRSALEDRNVLYGMWGIDHYGLGTNSNVVQNNLFCMGPSGFVPAQCAVGVDYNFGPKDNLVGGTEPGQRNVFGPTGNQGIEYSHGWNPSGPPGATDPTWQNSRNRAIGNWVGFRGDGSYDAAFRSGLTDPGTGDNGNAINVYDGSNDTLVEGNYIASAWTGIQLMMANSRNNVVRNNVIGVSPLGQAAPLSRWGMQVRINTRDHLIQGNTIRNAALGGIGLIEDNVQNIRISQNIVGNSHGPAIELLGVPGPDPNDPGDVDEGANHLLNTPEITSAETTLLMGTGTPGATVEIYRASRPVGEYGLPVAFVGSTLVGPDAVWVIPVSLPNSDRITSLQIDQNGNTSELSVNVRVGTEPPPPAPGDPLALDDFERTVSNGWGEADLGGPWAVLGSAADLSVANGTGRQSIAANQTREARLAIGVADVDITGRVSFDRIPVGGNAFAYVSARANATSTYRTTVRVAPNGAVFAKLTRMVNNLQSNVAGEVIVAGLTATPGGQLAFRFRVVGTQLQFRLWDAARAEPSTWNTQATDSNPSLQGPGGVALRSYIDATVSNGRILISFDDLEVRIP
jgi:CSLREA domain-containing protein